MKTDLSLEYIKEHYSVPADIGRRVVVDGKPGIIVKGINAHIGVNFDTDDPGIVYPCHPTWKVEYGEIGIPRKLTRSQQRYQKYLEVSDCYDSFKHFLL